MGDEAKKAADELRAELDKIDFEGGIAPAGTAPTPPSEPAKPAAEPEPTPDPEPEGEPTTQDEPEGEPKGQDPAASGDPTPDEPDEDAAAAIPDNHYRAALHMGMKPEDIASLYDANPDFALKTLAKCHEMVNANSQQLSALGRKAREMQQAPADPAAVPAPKEDSFVKRLREKYEDDPIIDVIAEMRQENTALRQQRQAPAQPQAQTQDQNIDQLVAIRQQVNNFFAADEMDAYGDFYGTTSQSGEWGELDPGQRANRTEVCDRAQLILDGAALAGMQVSVVEALERAHLEVMAPRAEEVVRNRIAQSLKKRSKGVTLKPSGSQTPAASDGKYNKAEAVNEIGAMMKEIFS